MVKSIFLVLAGALLHFFPSNVPPTANATNSAGFSGCALAAPQNVHIITTSTDFLELGWDPVPNAAFFRVQLFDISSGALSANKVVPASSAQNRATVDRLMPGHSYRIYVHSICSNGMESPKIN